MDSGICCLDVSWLLEIAYVAIVRKVSCED